LGNDQFEGVILFVSYDRGGGTIIYGARTHCSDRPVVMMGDERPLEEWWALRWVVFVREETLRTR